MVRKLGDGSGKSSGGENDWKAMFKILEELKDEKKIKSPPKWKAAWFVT